MRVNASASSDILSKEVLGNLGLTTDGGWDVLVTQRPSLVDGQDSTFFIKQGDTVVWDNGILEAGIGKRKAALRMRTDDDPDFPVSNMERKSRDPNAPQMKLLKSSWDPRLFDAAQRANDITGAGIRDDDKATRLMIDG